MFSEKSLTSFHRKKKKKKIYQAITVSSLGKLHRLCLIHKSHQGINETDLHTSCILFQRIVTLKTLNNSFAISGEKTAAGLSHQHPLPWYQEKSLWLPECARKGP